MTNMGAGRDLKDFRLKFIRRCADTQHTTQLAQRATFDPLPPPAHARPPAPQALCPTNVVDMPDLEVIFLTGFTRVRQPCLRRQMLQTPQ